MPWAAPPADHWIQDPQVGGGRIIGEGCHWLDLLSYLTGARIESVHADHVGDASGAITRGDADVVLTNPEMIGQPGVLAKLAGITVSHVVVDEAHCVSEWGETFRPSYLELGRVIRELAPDVATAFTATASPPVLRSVRDHLFGSDGAHLIQAVPDRPNISYSVLRTQAKLFALRRLLTGGG